MYMEIRICVGDPLNGTELMTACRGFRLLFSARILRPSVVHASSCTFTSFVFCQNMRVQICRRVWWAIQPLSFSLTRAVSTRGEGERERESDGEQRVPEVVSYLGSYSLSLSRSYSLEEIERDRER